MQHSHQASQTPFPPDTESTTPVGPVDRDAQAVFGHETVRHSVLVKINQLAREDVRHGLKEVAALDLVAEGGEHRGISYYHPLRYFTVTRPMGVEYIGEIEIEHGKSIHVRAHKASPHTPPSFHSLDTRPSSEGGAVFTTGDLLGWFDY